MKIVLASASPRRHSLLAQAGADFEVLHTDAAEENRRSFTPRELVLINAERKAICAYEFSAGSLIIACDTLVHLNGSVLGKPADEEEAFRMLMALSGKRHTVYTGVCIVAPSFAETGQKSLFVEETDVFMRKLSESEIERYIATGEPMDKAGAYGIQGKGSLLIEKITGDYFNVVGLPLCRLNQELEKLGCGLL